MKTYFISDLHFGVRNASVEWLKNQLSFFEEFLINKVEEDSYLIIGGDVFDNRQTINIFVYHSVFTLFKKLSNRFKEIHIIIGNHDISNKTTNEVNALSMFNLIDNIFVYEKPATKILGNSKFLFMPWMNGEEFSYIQKYKSDKPDYLVMHTNINSLQLNKYKEISNGVDIMALKDFKKVFNGHIHYRQEKNNIIMMGNPYHLNRNDLDNDKYIYCLDVNTHELTKIKNTFSPEFKQIDFYNLLEMNLPSAQKQFSNNYMYIRISNSITFDNGINTVLDNLDCAKNIKILYYDDNEADDIDVANYNEDLSVEKIMEEYIESIPQEDETKKQIKKILDKYRLELQN